MIGVMSGKGVADEVVWPELRAVAKFTSSGRRKIVKMKNPGRSTDGGRKRRG